MAGGFGGGLRSACSPVEWRPGPGPLLSRRDIPLRDKTLYRMLYETAARAAEILSLNVEDLDLENRRRR